MLSHKKRKIELKKEPLNIPKERVLILPVCGKIWAKTKKIDFIISRILRFRTLIVSLSKERLKSKNLLINKHELHWITTIDLNLGISSRSRKARNLNKRNTLNG